MTHSSFFEGQTESTFWCLTWSTDWPSFRPPPPRTEVHRFPLRLGQSTLVDSTTRHIGPPCLSPVCSRTSGLRQTKSRQLLAIEFRVLKVPREVSRTKARLAICRPNLSIFRAIKKGSHFGRGRLPQDVLANPRHFRSFDSFVVTARWIVAFARYPLAIARLNSPLPQKHQQHQ